MLKRSTLLLCIICLALLPAFGQAKAVLKNIHGKVEVKTVSGSWAPAKEGQVISLLDTISTGFNSTAELKIEDNIVQVAPLTRLTLDKLLEQSGKLTTNLYLTVGKITADVKSSKGLTQAFTAQSPVSTASVRGTKLVYDGDTLYVIEGTVKFILAPQPRDFSQFVAERVKQKKEEKDKDKAESGGESGDEEDGDGDGTVEGDGTGEADGGTGELELSGKEFDDIMSEVLAELVEADVISESDASDLLDEFKDSTYSVEDQQPAETDDDSVSVGANESFTAPDSEGDDGGSSDNGEEDDDDEDTQSSPQDHNTPSTGARFIIDWRIRS